VLVMIFYPFPIPAKRIEDNTGVRHALRMEHKSRFSGHRAFDMSDIIKSLNEISRDDIIITKATFPIHKPTSSILLLICAHQQEPTEFQ
jgi:hypothetical protein